MRSWFGALFSVLAFAAILAPQSAQAWWNGDWSYRKKITIDGSAKGAGIAADTARIPLLVRLHDGNFKFGDAKDDGSDLRFIDGDDKTPLKFHIEMYDGLLGIALVWVDIANVKAGASEDIWLYFGNPNATPVADPHGTFDSDTALVYHFADRGSAPRDETANSNAAQGSVKAIDNAVIGRGVHFDGAGFFTIPASPSLAIAAGSQFTWSGWVKPAAPQPGGVLFARHDGANALIIGVDQNTPYVSVTNGAAPVIARAAAALSPTAWHHIAVTASNQISLYVDGKLAATAAAALPALNAPATLGGDQSPAAPTPPPAPAAGTAPPSAANFVGDFDELEISKVARSAAFIAASAANQGASSAMLAYGEDEENAGWLSGGTFGVILRSVTIDGWVVIAILGLMAVMSWAVMILKGRYIGRVAGANARFLRRFAEASTDLQQFEAKLLAERPRNLRASVLYRISDAAAAELARRKAVSPSQTLTLSPQAVASIRANLDRIGTQEMQRLNSLMVLLTIAISGGPFLGLLGTVVGVMITFAAIAATGDVNINAIAPGMAAALMATVAGLAVAIPALFGYNYLITRIKELNAEMHSFSDEFVTRLAEAYQPKTGAE